MYSVHVDVYGGLSGRRVGEECGPRNHKGGRCKGVRCDFDLERKYEQNSNGYNSSVCALVTKVFLSMFESGETKRFRLTSEKIIYI